MYYDITEMDIYALLNFLREIAILHTQDLEVKMKMIY